MHHPTLSTICDYIIQLQSLGNIQEHSSNSISMQIYDGSLGGGKATVNHLLISSIKPGCKVF